MMKRKKFNSLPMGASQVFFLLSILFLLPLHIFAEEGNFYFLEYSGLLLLRYLPLVGLAGLIKLFLFKRKYSFQWEKSEKIIIKSLGEIVAELVFFWLFFLLLAPHISALVLEKTAFTGQLIINVPNLKIIFTIVILLPLQCFIGAILNVVLVYSCWPGEVSKSRKEFIYGVLLSLLLPLVLVVFFAAGILLKQQVAVF